MEELIIDVALTIVLFSALYVWGIMGSTFVKYVRGSEDPFYKRRKTRD